MRKKHMQSPVSYTHLDVYKRQFMPSVLDKVEKAAEWRTEHQAPFLMRLRVSRM